jgi:ribokinase
MTHRILVLGSSNLDFILKIPRFPNPGETLIGENLVTVFGGKGANQALAAKRLGGKVALITKLGRDPYGKSYRQYLIKNGMAPRYLLQDEKLPTGVAIIELNPQGENRIIVSPGANGALTGRNLKDLAPAWNGINVFVTQLEIPLPTVETALKMAKKSDAITLLNPSPAAFLSPEILAKVDFLVPNEWEAQLLTGLEIRKRGDLRKIAERLLARGLRNVIITLGPKGLFFKNRNEEIWMKAFRVKAVDTTAAGDAFMGGLACCLSAGQTIQEALKWASAAGALTTTRLGAQPSLPTQKDLGRFCSLLPVTREISRPAGAESRQHSVSWRPRCKNH